MGSRKTRIERVLIPFGGWVERIFLAGGILMRNLNLLLIPTGGDRNRKFKGRTFFYAMLGIVQSILIILLAAFLILERLPADLSSNWNWHALLNPKSKTVESSPLKSVLGGLDFKEINHLAEMIRFVTGDQLTQWTAWRYAGLIYHATKKYKLNPLEIVALITAESSFKANSVNKKTGDYGLGQINWEYWGKPLGLTPQELMDPSINIVMTCHVYKFFGEDFGKYHRGNGIQNKAYIVNIKSILSTLGAFARTNKKDFF